MISVKVTKYNRKKSIRFFNSQWWNVYGKMSYWKKKLNIAKNQQFTLRSPEIVRSSLIYFRKLAFAFEFWCKKCTFFACAHCIIQGKTEIHWNRIREREMNEKLIRIFRWYILKLLFTFFYTYADKISTEKKKSCVCNFSRQCFCSYQRFWIGA